MKQIVLQLAKQFPLGHKSARKETRFKSSFMSGSKIHSIRTGYERWKHNIDKINNGGYCLSVRQWASLPFRSKQVELKKLTSVGYQRITMQYNRDTGAIKTIIDGKQYLGDIKNLAKNDALSYQDFVEYFFGKCAHSDTLFQGIIIHFPDFRYQ